MDEKEAILENLKGVEDPELGVNIVDLGMIYEVEIEGGEARIVMTLTTMGCPMHDAIVRGATKAAERVVGEGKAHVTLTFDPPWDPERMSNAAKNKLGTI